MRRAAYVCWRTSTNAIRALRPYINFAGVAAQTGSSAALNELV
jgi:hypothetical protein